VAKREMLNANSSGPSEEKSFIAERMTIVKTSSV
jgi:hypothetical protein